MAIIKRYPWLSHFLGSPTGYVVHLQKGAVKHQGVGQAFFFRPANSVLSEVPVDDQELPPSSTPSPATTRTSACRPT